MGMDVDRACSEASATVHRATRAGVPRYKVEETPRVAERLVT